MKTRKKKKKKKKGETVENRDGKKTIVVYPFSPTEQIPTEEEYHEAAEQANASNPVSTSFIIRTISGFHFEIGSGTSNQNKFRSVGTKDHAS